MRNGNKQKLTDAGVAMKPCDFESMSIDQMWTLHEKITATLTEKIAAEKTRLEERLRRLEQVSNSVGRSVGQARRPYPRVFPKYRNPERPSETWAGRGKQPRWLSAQLKSGKKLDDFRIELSSRPLRLNLQTKIPPEGGFCIRDLLWIRPRTLRSSVGDRP
jgi:DNA-binding protein H-NS